MRWVWITRFITLQKKVGLLLKRVNRNHQSSDQWRLKKEVFPGTSIPKDTNEIHIDSHSPRESLLILTDSEPRSSNYSLWSHYTRSAISWIESETEFIHLSQILKNPWSFTHLTRDEITRPGTPPRTESWDLPWDGSYWKSVISYRKPCFTKDSKDFHESILAPFGDKSPQSKAKSLPRTQK